MFVKVYIQVREIVQYIYEYVSNIYVFANSYNIPILYKEIYIHKTLKANTT